MVDKEVVRFGRVLRVRETERDISRSELAAKIAEEEAILRGLREAREKEENALSDFCSGTDRVVSPQQLWFERQNLDILNEKSESREEDLRNCRSEIEEKKSDLLEKHRNVQLMGRHVDRLREKAFKAAIDAEQKNLDDIAGMRYARGTKEGS